MKSLSILHNQLISLPDKIRLQTTLIYIAMWYEKIKKKLHDKLSSVSSVLEIHNTVFVEVYLFCEEEYIKNLYNKSMEP